MTGKACLAGILGDALNPFVVFTALFLWVALAEAGPPAALGYVAVEVAAAGVVVGYLYVQARRGRVSGFWLPSRRERIVPALVLIATGLAAVAILWALGAPREVLNVGVSMFVAALAVAVLTLAWQASAHTTVAGHAAVCGLLLLGWWGLLFAATVPAVIWARVATRAHDRAQALAGAFVGGGVAALFFA
jgi:hypothetical protein